MACEYFNADLGLAIVRPEHQAFYRRVFLHETIAEPRLFPGLTQAGRTDGGGFPDLAEKVFERYPMMRSTAFERRMLFERGERASLPQRSLLLPWSAARSFRMPDIAAADSCELASCGFAAGAAAAAPFSAGCPEFRKSG